LANKSLQEENREDIQELVNEKIERTLNNSGVKAKKSIDSYRAYHLINVSYKCNHQLLTTFGLVGKFYQYAFRNKRAQYCLTNGYSCCSNNQVENTMKIFGKAINNFKKDLEPIIEVAVALKTESFIKFFSRNLKNPVCSRIFVQAFDKDPLSLNFNLKKFLKIIFG
jgi:hypothetical protein